jgi:ferric-dicitrate binding protein FerR (iron transport regulator)
VRRLFGNARGSFRTSGRNAAATVRGTRWSMQDRCDGTLVKVQQGRVAVRDFGARRTIVVRTGRTYLARRR